MSRVINCILCGGAGTRLWPLSRRNLPKQFIQLFNGRSLFQNTVQRNLSITNEMLVVSGVALHHLAQKQLEEEHIRARFILEPFGRNTAPAIAMACLMVEPEDVVLVTPSDHIITNNEAFEIAVNKSIEIAMQGFIATFGVQPTHPETGFGYIEYDGDVVVRFKEKPTRKIAEEYVESGKFLWNSGMFCFRASTMLKELQAHAPKILDSTRRAMNEGVQTSDGIVQIVPEHMELIPAISIDYAVMERSSKVKVVPCDLGWSDLGSFDSLYEEFSSNDSENVVLHESITPFTSRQEPWMNHSMGNLVIQSKRKIALLGVSNLLVIDTPDAILIAERGSSQQVSQLSKELDSQQSHLVESHTTTYRPWGYFENLVDEPGYKVKRIVVHPHQKLSLQKHANRAEHWTIVSGVGWVRNGNEEFELQVSESTFIPTGVIHRLENRTDNEVVLIEVQTGSYTGEDDIIRLDDIYGRK